MDIELEVVGIVAGVSKKSGKAYYMLHLLKEFTGSNTQVQQGQECIVQYFEGTVPTDIAVGSSVVFDYAIGFGCKPMIAGVHAV